MGSPISIYDVVRILGLEPRPGAVVEPGSRQASFKCPICMHRGYTLSINFQKDTFVCPKCWSKGGATQLYSLVRYGERYQPRTPRAAEIITAMRNEITGRLASTAISTNYVPHVQETDVAPDYKLDRVYRALLALPRFQLTEKHRENLRRRGLSDLFIAAAGFRSLNTEFEIPKKARQKIREFAQTLPAPISETQLALGGYIVHELKMQGVSEFNGVPGFFKHAGCWWLYVTPGIMIPTKNEKGQIVSIQIRKDKGDLRYMTLSNKSLPEHVQSGISRVHVVGTFDYHSPELVRRTPFAVLLTEGPLKADVIVHLWRKYRDETMRCLPDDIIVLAIQGINNTTYLGPALDWLKTLNVQTVYNCLDMDRITNKNVRSGSAALRRLLNEKGFKFPSLCWGWDTSKEMRIRLKKLAAQYNVPLPRNTGNPYTSFALLCEALEERGIVHSSKGNYWPDCSKGLDDWLHYQQLNHAAK